MMARGLLQAALAGLGSLALAGCMTQYDFGPTPLTPAPGASYAAPAPYRPGSYQAAPYQPSGQALPPMADPAPADDLPPIVFQPNAPAPAPNPDAAPDTVPKIGDTALPAPGDTSPAPATAAVPAAVQPAATPDKGADVPMMGFRPMKGQKAPAASAAP